MDRTVSPTALREPAFGGRAFGRGRGLEQAVGPRVSSTALTGGERPFLAVQHTRRAAVHGTGGPSPRPASSPTLDVLKRGMQLTSLERLRPRLRTGQDRRLAKSHTCWAVTRPPPALSRPIRTDADCRAAARGVRTADTVAGSFC